MNKKDARKRIEELKKITAYHAKKYYDDDNPEISDFEYDMLMLELRNLENDFPFSAYLPRQSLGVPRSKEVHRSTQKRRLQFASRNRCSDIPCPIPIWKRRHVICIMPKQAPLELRQGTQSSS